MSSSQDSEAGRPVERPVSAAAARSGAGAPKPAAKKAVRKPAKKPATEAAAAPAANTPKAQTPKAKASAIATVQSAAPKPVPTPAEAKPAASSAPPPVQSSAPPAFSPPPQASAKAQEKPQENPQEKPAAPERAAPNFERMADNMARAMEQFGKAMAAMVKPVEQGKVKSGITDDVTDAVKTFGHVAEYWLADPRRTIEAQSALSTQFLGLWANTLRRFSGEEEKPFLPSDPKDKRFASPDWKDNPGFDFLRQAYGIANNWCTQLVEDAEIDKRTQDKAAFYVKQMAGALSPSNFLLTNPELLRTTWSAEGENLARGMKMLAEDIEAGNGSIRIRQTSGGKFEVGVNLATTPGKVVFRNDLIELLQYTPTTEQVYKRPLLIIPPWINKFYILDLNPEKSFIRWAVSEGLTVFCISWINPDARHANKDFEAYMREGVFAALEQVEKITDEKQVTSVGYCVGGTLAAATLAYMAAKHDDRINSATLFTTQVDFSEPGDLKVFADEDRIKNIEEEMHTVGYLEGRSMANAFNMLRPNDMIWSYVVNNYLKGIEPMAFDLLTWNSDSTRMPRANHSYYLRNCYLENRFAKKQMKLGDEMLDLGKIKIPIYNLAAREDHIAPAKSVFNGAKLFGGEMRYVMGGSGHIAGVVNPPGPKPKYQYWTGPRPAGAFEDWVARAEEHPGSWWPDWLAWIDAQAPEKVPAREPGGGRVPLLGDAPGDYVRIKA
jgi:polyhydroxyalkanoate synthase